MKEATTVRTGLTAQSSYVVRSQTQPFHYSSFDGRFDLCAPLSSDYSGIENLMCSRYYTSWKPPVGEHIIRIVRDNSRNVIVAVVIIIPFEGNFLVDHYETEWDGDRASVAARRAAPLVEEFLRNFKKAIGRKVFSVVLLDNARHQNIIGHRGWSHVANLMELET